MPSHGSAAAPRARGSVARHATAVADGGAGGSAARADRVPDRALDRAPEVRDLPGGPPDARQHRRTAGTEAAPAARHARRTVVRRRTHAARDRGDRDGREQRRVAGPRPAAPSPPPRRGEDLARRAKRRAAWHAVRDRDRVDQGRGPDRPSCNIGHPRVGERAPLSSRLRPSRTARRRELGASDHARGARARRRGARGPPLGGTGARRARRPRLGA